MSEEDTEKIENNQPSSNLEEGMFYERVVSPEKVRVEFNDKQELTKLVFEDKNGQTLEISDKRLVSRCLMYFAKYTEFGKVSELRALQPDILQQALNTAIPKRNKDLKAMYDPSGKLCGIASTMHEQISWANIKEIVQGVIQEVTGKVEMPEGSEHPFKWSYKVPVKDKNVSAWVGVHAGNNIIKGRSGIRVFTRFRTEKEGVGGAPACLNWCGMWQLPQQWHNLDIQKLGLDNIIKLIGAEEVKNIQMAQFHIKPDMEAFKSELHEGLQNMIKAMKKITPVINKSVHSPLSRTEMENILLAYQSKARSYLPDYLLEQILDHVEEETVWGFSNAVSWVRTHGNFKFTDSSHPMFKPLEDRDMVWRLENIAGEVLSLTPTINDIHLKHGEITLEFLVGEEQAKEIQETRRQKLEKELAKATPIPVVT